MLLKASIYFVGGWNMFSFVKKFKELLAIKNQQNQQI